MKTIFAKQCKAEDKGLTLIELLITIGVLAVLTAITAPIITSVIEQSRIDAQKGEMLLMADSIEKSIAGMGGINPENGSFNLGNGSITAPVIYPAGEKQTFRFVQRNPSEVYTITPSRDTRLRSTGLGTQNNPYTGFCITAWVGNKNLTVSSTEGFKVVAADEPPCGLIPGPISVPQPPQFNPDSDFEGETTNQGNVTGVERTPDGGSANVYFDEVPNNQKGGESDLLQIIEYRATCTADGEDPIVQTGTVSPILVEGLSSGTEYTCTVAARNNGTGAEEWSGESDETVPFTMPVPPNAPTVAQGTGSGGQIAMVWTPPTNDGGLPITKYAIRFSEETNGENSTDRITSGNEIRISMPTIVEEQATFALSNAAITSFNSANGTSVPTLENGKAYYVSVAAINNAGESVTIEPRLAWAEAPANPAYGAWGAVTDAGTGASTIRTATEPWDIRLGNSTYRGAGADADYPTNLTITDGANKITVTWNPPNNGGVPILRYDLQYDVANTFDSGDDGEPIGSPSNESPSSGGQSVMIEDLPNSTSYFVRVRSCNAITNMGDGGCAQWTYAQAQAGATLAPADPPENVEAGVDESGTGTVTWE
jgi:prepilin-type N-terminal cleavage/methylation domain-containing protein